MTLHVTMLVLAAGAAAVGGSDTGGSGSGSHDLLYGTIFTGLVTLILGLAGIIFTRQKPVAISDKPTDAQLEIRDLKKQRDTLQRKDKWKGEYISNLRDCVRKLGEDPNLSKPDWDEP